MMLRNCRCDVTNPYSALAVTTQEEAGWSYSQTVLVRKPLPVAHDVFFCEPEA